MLRSRHQLARLHAAELREAAVRRLVAPDALRGRQHRVAAVAVLVVAVVLIAMHDDFVADLPALHLGADRPDHAGGVGAGDVVRTLVHVVRRDRLARGRPRRRCNSRPPPSRAPAPRRRRPARSARLRSASRIPAGRGDPCESPRRTFFPARDRAAGFPRSHRAASVRTAVRSLLAAPWRAPG